MSNQLPFVNVLQSLTCGPHNENLSLTFDVKILPPRTGGNQPFYAIYLLDISGSMAEHNKIESARDSFIEQVKTLPEGTMFTLVTFGPAKVRIKEEKIDAETRPKIIKEITKLKVWGDTPMHGALEKAFEVLKSYKGPLQTKKITLISDGQPTDLQCSDKDADDENFKEFMKFAQLAIEYKASIDTVGALYGHNVLLLYELARRSTGKYIFANSEQELKEKMTIVSQQNTQIMYNQPTLSINPLLGTCSVKDAVQFKPTVIRMPFERIGNRWKAYMRSFEAGDTYELLFKLDYKLSFTNIREDEPLRILDFEFNFGSPALSVTKDITIQFSENPADFKLNQQIVKEYVSIFSQVQDIDDSTRKGDAEKTQRVQGDETRKNKEH